MLLPVKLNYNGLLALAVFSFLPRGSITRAVLPRHHRRRRRHRRFSWYGTRWVVDGARGVKRPWVEFKMAL